jgi:hypothetical protein
MLPAQREQLAAGASVLLPGRQGCFLGFPRLHVDRRTEPSSVRHLNFFHRDIYSARLKRDGYRS